MPRSITIAIDGPILEKDGCRTVAKRLDYAYIDTGAMYRVRPGSSVGLDHEHAEELGDRRDLDFVPWSAVPTIVNGEDWSDAIRTETVVGARTWPCMPRRAALSNASGAARGRYRDGRRESVRSCCQTRTSRFSGCIRR